VRQIGLGTFEATPEMFNLVNQVLRSGRISYGPVSQEFESRFAQMHGCKYGVLSNSGTSSLLVALQTLKEMHGWNDGDEVIVPALTFVATVNVVLQLRLKPVLVDIEQDYYGLNPFYSVEHNTQFREAITNKTRCVIPVHVFGQSADMLNIKAIADNANLRIIEDSCESMLVNHYGRKVGSWGDISVFSTYIAHLLVTGVGGLSTTNNPDYAQYMRSLVNHGIDLSELPTGEQYDTTWFNRKFLFDKVGHSFRLTELEAAIGLAQLDDLAGIIKKRQFNASYLTANLEPLGDRLQLPAIRPNTEHAFMMYPIVCVSHNLRDSLMRHLNDKGIGTRLMLPLTQQPVYKGLWNPDDYPVAKWINENGFYIGIHQGLSREDLDYIVEVFWGYFS
jgi:perosamine synthetase